MICPDCGCDFDEIEDPDRCPACGWPIIADNSSTVDRELEEAGYTTEDGSSPEEEDDYPW